MSNYLISDLEPEYVTYLYQHIPILESSIDGELLLQLILNYCKDCKLIRSTLKYYNIRDNSLSKINLFLKKMIKTEKKLNGFNNNENNNKSKVTYTKNKAIKKNNIDALGLIEGIILCTLNYYKIKNKNNNKKFPNINVNISNNQTKLNLKMSIAPGKDLGNTIIDLYKDSKVTDKNSELFNILIEISKKLDYLQKNCGFIHGDFHSGNIFVDKKINEKNGKEEYIITFIDFEYSTIKLPSNKNIILTSPVSENISRSDILNLDENGLKALDLFHLIENLKSFRENNRTVNKFKNHTNQFIQLNNFIDELSSIYENKIINGKIHLFTIKPGFFNESYSNLYPEIFSKIKLNNLPKIPNISTSMLSISLGNIYSSPPVSRFNRKRGSERSNYNSNSPQTKILSKILNNSYKSPPLTP